MTCMSTANKMQTALSDKLEVVSPSCDIALQHDIIQNKHLRQMKTLNRNSCDKFMSLFHARLIFNKCSTFQLNVL